MKQTKAILHNRFNGENTPVEHLDDSLGNMIVDKMIFPYAVRQFDPHNTNDMGKRFDPRRSYSSKGAV
jgi:ABC-type iron transport system FetAB ATPase subunit